MTLIPYHHRPKFSVRPHNFRVVPDHPLWRLCTIASLGQLPGTLTLRDSTLNRYTTSLVNMSPNAWIIDIQRSALVCVEGDNHRIQFDLRVATDLLPQTMAVWGYLPNIDNIQVYTSVNHVVFGNRQWFLSYWTGQGLGLVIRNGGGLVYDVVDPAGIYGWRHIYGQVTGEGPADRQVYIDGEFAAQSSTPIDAIVASNFCLGMLGDSSPAEYDGTNADAIFWQGRTLEPEEIRSLADRTNVMLSGAIEPVPTQIYSIPVGVTPAGIVTDIFESAIISPGT